jgi:hypothetical protein
MKRRTHPCPALVSLAVVLLGGCATGRAKAASGRPDLLTREQIMSVQGVTNLYDVVQRLRPRWLIARAENRTLGGASVGILVYQEQTLLGDVETLRQLQPEIAYELRFLDGTTASTTLPGLGGNLHIPGAIIISTHAH